MKAAFSLLEDWKQLQELLKSMGISRAHLKRHFTAHELKRSLRARDEISISLDVLNPNGISPFFAGEAPKIIQENDDFFVIHKPAGIHGHPLHYEERDNVLSWMRSQNLGHYLNVAKDSHERGLLYRLDQATSGVLIYVKREDLWRELRENFHKVTHLKRYIALVDTLPEQTGELAAWFDLSGKKVKAYKEHKESYLEGSLNLQVLTSDERGHVLAIDLKHGHRHQIRAHLAALGCPIRGDQVYGGSEGDRLYLHAYLYKLGQQLSACDSELGFGRDFLHLNCDF